MRWIVLLLIAPMLVTTAGLSRADLVNGGPNGEMFYDEDTSLWWFDPDVFVGMSRADVDNFVNSRPDCQWATGAQVDGLVGKSSLGGVPLEDVMGPRQFTLDDGGPRWIGYHADPQQPDGWLAQSYHDPGFNTITEAGFQGFVDNWVHGAWVICTSVEGCDNCGPGPHWIDLCAQGIDAVVDQRAKVGIDLDLDPSCIADLSMVMNPCPSPNNQVLIKRSDPLDDSQQFAGLRPVDGHMDVIDTEILRMCMTAGGVTLRAGAGQGQGAALQATFGAIAENPADPNVGESFFNVFFEIDLGGGNYLYNHYPLRLSGDITCIPPQVGYVHVVDCIALYTDPVGGQHVANLTSAEHVVNPGPDRAVCCFGDICQIMFLEDCLLENGVFHPEWDSCQPNPCLQPEGEECEACGPGVHWIDQCGPGVDAVDNQRAKVGIDMDLDPECTADLSMVMNSCPAPNDQVVISRSGPLDDSQNFPGLRAVDAHFDVIDTEILRMCLTSGGITLRAGLGQGQGGDLKKTLGAIAEKVGDPAIGESFFNVYFEIDLGGGSYLYNQDPLTIEGDLTCVPPQVGYIHIVDCLPLFDAPEGGNHIANLTSAEHVVNPGPEPAVCCLEDGCRLLLLEECFELNGDFYPDLTSCEPDPCPGPSGVDDSGRITGMTALYSAVPNPLSGRTVLKYYLAESGRVDIDIYDASGRLVRRLLSKAAESGLGSVEWDGRDDAGNSVSSGTYFARLRAGGEVVSRRMIVLR